MNPAPHILELQRRQRQNATRSETILWQALRGAQIANSRLQRQKAFERYIVDFYCASAKLISELDGPIHDTLEAQQYDAARTESLEARGLHVKRFKNQQVVEQLPAVLEEIRAYLLEHGKSR